MARLIAAQLHNAVADGDLAAVCRIKSGPVNVNPLHPPLICSNVFDRMSERVSADWQQRSLEWLRGEKREEQRRREESLGGEQERGRNGGG